MLTDNLPTATALERKLTDIVCRGRTTPGQPQRNDTGYWKDLAWMTASEYEALHAQVADTATGTESAE